MNHRRPCTLLGSLFKTSWQITSRARRFATGPSKDLPDFDPAPSFRLTMGPNPNWVPCQGTSSCDMELDETWAHDPDDAIQTWNPVQLAPRRVHTLLNSAVVPRPIALLSTVSAQGRPNLILSSYFSLVAHKPPLVSVSLAVTSCKSEETRANMMATKEFTVSIVSEPFAEAANVTSVDAPEHADLWALSGLTMARSLGVKPAWVRESAVGFECKLYHALDIPEPETGTLTQTIMLGRIQQVHVRRSVLGKHGTIDPTRLRAVSRLGGSMYARIGEGFHLRRPNWSEIKRARRGRRSDGGGGGGSSADSIP